MNDIPMNSLKDVKVIKVKPLFKFWFEIARKAIQHIKKHMTCQTSFSCVDFPTEFLNSITNENAKHVDAFGLLTNDKEKSELICLWIRKYYKQLVVDKDRKTFMGFNAQQLPHIQEITQAVCKAKNDLLSCQEFYDICLACADYFDQRETFCSYIYNSRSLWKLLMAMDEPIKFVCTYLRPFDSPTRRRNVKRKYDYDDEKKRLNDAAEGIEALKVEITTIQTQHQFTIRAERLADQFCGQTLSERGLNTWTTDPTDAETEEALKIVMRRRSANSIKCPTLKEYTERLDDLLRLMEILSTRRGAAV
jgi:hypothetical protein